MKPNEPRSLLDPRSSAPAILREALGNARAFGPSADDLAALRASLPLGGGPGGSGPRGGAPALSPPRALPTVPLAASPPASILSAILIGAALGVVVAGGWLLQSSAPERQADLALASARAPTIATTTASLAPLTSAAADMAVKPPASGAPMSPSAQPSASAPSAAAPQGPRRLEHASTVSRAREDALREFGETSSGVVSPPAPASEGETEAQLLQRAQKLITVDPERARVLTLEHAARFPSGALEQEREVVAIQSLLRLGRVDEARARAARFSVTFPESAHRPAIEALVNP